MQKEGYKCLTGLGRQKPCKKFGRKRQKILSGAQPSWRERGKFEKVSLKQSNLTLKKNLIHEFRSIEKQPRSIETDRDFNKEILKKFDRSKQSEALSNIFKKFRLIEKQNRSIEMGRGSLNLKKKLNFLKKIQKQLTAWKLKNKMHEYVMM